MRLLPYITTDGRTGCDEDIFPTQGKAISRVFPRIQKWSSKSVAIKEQGGVENKQ